MPRCLNEFNRGIDSPTIKSLGKEFTAQPPFTTSVTSKTKAFPVTVVSLTRTNPGKLLPEDLSRLLLKRTECQRKFYPTLGISMLSSKDLEIYNRTSSAIEIEVHLNPTSRSLVTIVL